MNADGAVWHGEMGAAHAVDAEQVPAIGSQHLIVAAVPNRGQRDGSSCSTIACTFDVDCSGETVPPVAVMATTSSEGRRRHAQSHGVVDAGIYVEDYFSGHPSRRPSGREEESNVDPSGRYSKLFSVNLNTILSYLSAATAHEAACYNPIMPHEIASLLGHVAGGGNLSFEEMAAAFDAIMSGGWSDDQIGMLLTALAAKGETVDEIAGAAEHAAAHDADPVAPCRGARYVRHGRRRLEDVQCQHDGRDRGGGGRRAGCQAWQRSITSRSGSADVLTELGVNINASTHKSKLASMNWACVFVLLRLRIPR